MIASNIWEEILSRVQAKVNRHSFYTWFKPTSFVADDGSTVTVKVPNALFKDWITKHYSGVIAEALDEVRRTEALVHFVASGTPEAEAPAATARAVTASTSPNLDAGGRNLEPGMRNAETGASLEDVLPPVQPTSSAGLNPRYTFDTFIVGSSNQFAHAACRAVAEAPSRSYNPLFIYGGVGLGKTHLMHAIGHYVLLHDRNLVLTYISSERFMNEMINAVRYDRLIDFRERYRSVDVLLVDDVQFLAGKEGTQNEFFHTFNALYDSQKQIVLSSDCPPHEIEQLEERLRSRFEWGLIADIQSPDLETKVAIQNDGRGRGRPVARSGGNLHSRPHQVEHSGTGGIADSTDSVCLVDGPRALSRSGAGCPAQRQGSRRESRHHRSHPEVHLGLLPAEADRPQVAEQLEVDRDAAASRDVFVQDPHSRIAAGDRPELRRQASLDRDSLDSQGRRAAQGRCAIQHTSQQLHRGFTVRICDFHRTARKSVHRAVQDGFLG
jgi:chromosomal replication initiator protein DnaA